MGRLSLWPAVLGLALAMIVVTAVVHVPHSLGYAGVAVVVIGLLGWVIEAREVAGPPPPVEEDHGFDEEEEAPGPSYWPIVLAVGIVCIAAGLIYGTRWGAMIAAVPLAIGAAAGWASSIRHEMEAARASRPVEAGPPIVASGGRVLMPVPSRVLATQAAGGAAIAIERVETTPISRRGVLRLAFWAGLGAGVASIGAYVVNMLYPRGITGFGGTVSPGLASQFAEGTKTQIPEGHFWLVNLTAEQGGPGFLALWWKCPHLGCTVPWRADFKFPDPTTGAEKAGWFRCPCHGSTYNDAGVRVYGPAPRSMDHMALTIDPSSGRITVNTGKVTKGTPDNPSFAVKA
jgi:cytochrome b6-f complex iron-sulfur subunit